MVYSNNAKFILSQFAVKSEETDLNSETKKRVLKIEQVKKRLIEIEKELLHRYNIIN